MFCTDLYSMFWFARVCFSYVEVSSLHDSPNASARHHHHQLGDHILRNLVAVASLVMLLYPNLVSTISLLWARQLMMPGESIGT